MKKGHMTVKKFKVIQILYLYQELTLIKKIIEKATEISFYIAETQNNNNYLLTYDYHFEVDSIQVINENG